MYNSKPQLTREEAIKELGCRDKKCPYFDEDGLWSFCSVLFTDKCCLNLDKKMFNQVIKFPEISTKTIKVQIEEDRFGCIIITPINKKYAKFYDFYLQVDWQIQDFLDEYPKARYGRKNEYGNYEINDGEIFIMETDRFLEYWGTYC